MGKTIDVKLALSKHKRLRLIIDELDENTKDVLTKIFTNSGPNEKKYLRRIIETDNPEVKQFIMERTARVVKNTESENYEVTFNVSLPVGFYFNKDGSFDGIDVDVRRASEWERLLAKDLTLKLSKSLSQ